MRARDQFRQFCTHALGQQLEVARVATDRVVGEAVVAADERADATLAEHVALQDQRGRQ